MRKYKAIFSAIIRFIAYSLLMVGLNLLFRYDAAHPVENAKFGEASLTEMTQELFLFLSSAIFLIAGLRTRDMRAFANLVACFLFASFIREFNNYLPHWFYFVLPVLALSVYLFIRDFRKFWPAVEKFFSLSVSAYFLIGLITTYVFSRFFGKTDFWQMIMEGSYTRYAKNAGEECIELLGYTLILISSVEFLIHVLQRKRAES